MYGKVLEYINSMNGWKKTDIKPLIFFIEDMTDDAFIKQVDNAVKKLFKTSLTVIEDEGKLLEASRILKNQDSGATLLPCAYGRGVNLRYAIDAEVIVVGNGSSLNWDTVCQMVGRSSRRFGLQKGRVYAVSSIESIGAGAAENFLKAKVRAANDEGILIAKTLFQKVGDLSAE